MIAVVAIRYPLIAPSFISTNCPAHRPKREKQEGDDEQPKDDVKRHTGAPLVAV